MNKEEFFAALKAKLSDIDEASVRDSISYYSEMIDDAIEDGMTPDEAVASMGSPEDIAAQIRMDASAPQPETLIAPQGDICNVDRPFSSIRVRCRSFDVDVLPSEDGKTRVECDKADKYITVCVRHNTLNIEEKRRHRWHFRSVTVSLYLPQNEYASLLIESASGDISVPEGFAFERVSLHSVSGDVTVRAKASKRLDAKSVSGDVSALDISDCGKIMLSAVSGDVQLTGARASEIDLATVSGDCQIDECDAELLTLKSISGDITGSLLSPKNFSTRSVCGSIRVPYPDPQAPRCTATTTSGDIDISVRS